MTFFSQNSAQQPEEAPAQLTEHADALAKGSPYSGKSQPLFKQGSALPDSLPGQHISLSAYISKHLQEGESHTGNPEASDPKPQAASGFRAFPTPPGKTSLHPTGQVLNSLDVEMAAGLEQYLPSPVFRLRIAKKRLDKEVTELRQRLNKYERLPEQSSDLKARIASLKVRLKALEANQRKVNAQLATNPGIGGLLTAVLQPIRWVQTMIQKGLTLLRAGLLTLFYGRAFWEMQANGNEMVYLKELYAERLKDRTSADSELSAIINRFEQVVQRVEQGPGKFRPILFPLRLWQDVKRLVK